VQLRGVGAYTALTRRAGLVWALALAVIAVAFSGCAQASNTLESMLQDDGQMLSNPAGTLHTLRLLGIERVRIAVRWLTIAPNPRSHRRPRHFNAADPAAYPQRNWAVWDEIVRDAQADQIKLNFNVVGGAPLWATGRGAPRHSAQSNWEPSAREFGLFMRALATRYSGSYDPALKRTVPGDANDLPAVTYWSIWNEPDYGPSLAPQGLPGRLRIDHSPEMYRGLLDAAWKALRAAGHRRDTVLFGEVAPRGYNFWGVFSGMKPLVFVRSLYCLDSRYRKLRGKAARIRGCPANARGFRRAHPALFQATGFADHPYMRWYAPNHEPNPDPITHQSTKDYSSLGTIGQLKRTLNRAQRAYGSRRRLPIYDTEFGYITSPPKHSSRKSPYPSQATAAYYENWAEYLHWRDPQMRSFMQYLLIDPLPALASNDYGGFASGLINFGPQQIPKLNFYAFRMPLYLPVTSTRAGHSVEVWGCVRPARYPILDGSGPQTAVIQFAPDSSHSYSTFTTVEISNPDSCYFDTHLVFPTSGNVRIMWGYPTGSPYEDPLNPSNPIFSRAVHVTVR
jgi:hypothetical protein